MSQLVTFVRDDLGFIIADSNIVDRDSNKLSKTEKKVFKGKRFIIATAGVSYGLYIVEGLMNCDKNMGFSEVSDVVNFLINYGNEQYKTFLEHYKNKLNPNFLRLYFSIVGFEEKKLKHVIVGQEGFENLKEFSAPNIFTFPRRLGIELSLTKHYLDDAKELINISTKYLEKIAKLDNVISAPFYYEIITCDLTS